MAKSINRITVATGIIVLCGAICLFVCNIIRKGITHPHDSIDKEILRKRISKIVNQCHGEIGVALIINNEDTVTVSNGIHYPMMSVFKVHQAIAICNFLDRNGSKLDSIITINRKDLNHQTWSPMLKDHKNPVINLSIADLLRYTLIHSDNNASNILFETLVCPETTDSLIATIIPRASFKISFSENEMFEVHDRAYSNYTTPLGAAELINRLFTDSLVSNDKQSFIMNTLEQCETGRDRIVAPLLDTEGITIAHKTGSGYVNDMGELVAHNDVAYIRLPNKTAYSLAIFVKDFKGNQVDASNVIAEISALIYSVLQS